MTLFSFRKMNPDWQMDLYCNEKTVLTPELTPDFIKAGRRQDFWFYEGLDYFSKIKELNINIIKWNTEEVELNRFKNITPSGKSNLFKWYQLYKNGGIYSDMDILFFKPIDELYNQWNKENINVVICQTKYISIGLMASTSENDFFKDIFYNTFKFEKHYAYQAYGVLNVYDLYKSYGCYGQKILPFAIEKYPHLKFFNLPMDVVYHYNNKNIGDCFHQNCAINITDFPENAIGYHWYAGGGVAQKFNNLLNHNNYLNYNYLFCKLCKNYFN